MDATRFAKLAHLPAFVAALWLVTACKNRAIADDARVRDEATQTASGQCAPLSTTDSDQVQSTSLMSMVARSKDASCKARLLRLPMVRQTKGFTCGAASVKSILFYFGDFMAETELQRILRSHKDQGTSFTRIMRLFHGLNDKVTRERISAMHGFDSLVELSDLEKVLNDPDVLRAIGAKAATSEMHESVLKGISALREDAVDIDKIGNLTASFSLDATGEISGDGSADAGRRVQHRPRPPQEPHQNKYKLSLFFEAKPYNPGGPVPATCPSAPPKSAAAQFAGTRAMTLTDLERAIDQGNPVLALTQAWSYSNERDYDLASYEKGWSSGHYVVVVGYDQQNIYFMDPYNMGHYAFLPKADWEKRWHDYDGLLTADYSQRCPGGIELHRWGLVVSRDDGPAYNADRITKMY